MMNPFLSNAVYTACDQARVPYLDLLARKQMYGGTPISDLSITLERHKANIDMSWKMAEQAAFIGDISSASTQLASIVMEWGAYKAHQDLIDTHGTYLDPADPDTVNDFVCAVDHKVVFWATALMNKLNEGERQRKSDQGLLYIQRQAALFDVQNQIIQNQGQVLDKDHQYNQQRQAALFDRQNQIIQNQGQALDKAHQYNQQYADVALRGSQQAQEAARSIMEHAETMYADIQESMRENLNAQKVVTENIVQHLPREMARAQSRSCLTRGLIVVLMILACPVALWVAYLILTQVVLH
jgi:hypothetical protein